MTAIFELVIAGVKRECLHDVGSSAQKFPMKLKDRFRVFHAYFRRPGTSLDVAVEFNLKKNYVSGVVVVNFYTWSRLNQVKQIRRTNRNRLRRKALPALLHGKDETSIADDDLSAVEAFQNIARFRHFQQRI